MMTAHVVPPRLADPLGLRSWLSLKETAILAEISEGSIRKDIENGWLDATKAETADGTKRIVFAWLDVFAFAAIYSNEMLSGPVRKRAMCDFKYITTGPDSKNAFWVSLKYEPSSWMKWNSVKLNLDKYIVLDCERAFNHVGPRMDLYAEGLRRVNENEAVLGGEPVFKGTRLSVHHIGKMVSDGESISNILEDYPYLKENDVKFAMIYHLAHPALGRPRNRSESKDGSRSTS